MHRQTDIYTIQRKSHPVEHAFRIRCVRTLQGHWKHVPPQDFAITMEKCPFGFWKCPFRTFTLIKSAFPTALFRMFLERQRPLLNSMRSLKTFKLRQIGQRGKKSLNKMDLRLKQGPLKKSFI